MQRQLKIQGQHYQALKDHLFPGDGKEAVAVLLCGRHESADHTVLLSHQLLLIPHGECERTPHRVQWKTDRVLPFFELAEKHNFAILKIHSHPTGYPHFSEVDDESDAQFFPAAFSWSETNSVHASLVMLPGGDIFGRVFQRDMSFVPLDKITIAGDEIKIWHPSSKEQELDGFAKRTIQAFGEGTYGKLRHMKIGVVGCSGTGSPTVEQLVRLGVGTIVLIDPDQIEVKNLNRILNATRNDVGKAKVDVLAAAIREMGLGTNVITFETNLYDSMAALLELITCDVIFGCMDSVDGRHLLSQLTNFYLVPYFDLGVRLQADGKGGIQTIVGSSNYIQPGMSSLLSRGLYSHQRLTAESMQRSDPESFQDLVKRKYIDNVDVDRPAVIPVNMLISSMGVMEMLNRIHGFKDEEPANYARVMVDYSGGCIDNSTEDSFGVDESAAKWAGRGDCSPFLRMPELVAHEMVS